VRRLTAETLKALNALQEQRVLLFQSEIQAQAAEKIIAEFREKHERG